MSCFRLQIVTPDGVAFDGEAQSVTVRSSVGDVCIMAKHIDYVTTIDAGMVKIKDADGNIRKCACADGFLSVKKDIVRIAATTFEFSEDIDLVRAKAAKEKAEKRIAAHISDADAHLAEIKLKRALARIGVKENNR